MLVLITYDVNTEDPAGRKRLRQIARQCVNYGQRVQNSVFECMLDTAQCKVLQAKLLSIMDPERDSLRFYYLGKRYDHRPERLRFQTLSFPRWNHSETKCGIPPSSPRAFARVFPGRSSFQRQPGNSISSMRPQLSPQSPRSSLWIDTASRHLPSICVLCF